MGRIREKRREGEEEEEEEEKKEEGRRQEIKGMDLYGFLWIILWNLYEICMDLFVWIFFLWILVWRFEIPLCL